MSSPTLPDLRPAGRLSLPVFTPADCKGCGACCRHVGHPMVLRYARPRLPAEPAWRVLPRRLELVRQDCYFRRGCCGD
jgi:hypothetical protein